MFQIRVLSGSKAGQILPLVQGQPFVVGRGAEANFSFPDDPTLSRVHADIVFEGGQWMLRNKSQHGSLVAGQVVHANVPLRPGTEFQVGGTKMILEGAPAGGAAPAAAAGRPGPTPAATPQPVGTPVGAASGAPASGGSGGDVNKDAAAAMAGAKAFAAGLPGGPVKIQHSGPGFPIGDILKGALGIVKANLIPSVIIAAPMALVIFISLFLQFGARFLPNAILGMIGLLMGVLSLVLFLVYVLGGPQIATNYIKGVREYQTNGTKMSIGMYFRMEDLVPRYICSFVVGAANMCFGAGIILFGFSLPILADYPGTPFANALKASLAYSKKNIVPMIILLIAIGILNMIGYLCCGVGMLITGPACLAAIYLAYEVKREEVKAAAAEAGIVLG
jgi:hypothetical protein